MDRIYTQNFSSSPSLLRDIGIIIKSSYELLYYYIIMNSCYYQRIISLSVTGMGK